MFKRHAASSGALVCTFLIEPLLLQVAAFFHRHFVVDRDGEAAILVYSTSGTPADE